MFTAFPSFKHPVQFGNDPPAYLALELTLHAPWLIAESVEGDYTRTFLLSGLAELEGVFIQEEPFGPLDCLSAIFPPTWSPTGEWSMARIKEIQRLEGQSGPMSLMLVSEHEARYSGFPIQPVDEGSAAGLCIKQISVGARP